MGQSKNSKSQSSDDENTNDEDDGGIPSDGEAKTYPFANPATGQGQTQRQGPAQQAAAVPQPGPRPATSGDLDDVDTSGLDTPPTKRK